MVVMGKIYLHRIDRGREMVKGINKQMIVLKLEGNRLYDSACFLLKNNPKPCDDKRDMVYEANRILSRMEVRKDSAFSIKWKKWLLLSAAFLLGAVIGAVIGVLVFK